jgi:LysM repeat protein
MVHKTATLIVIVIAGVGLILNSCNKSTIQATPTPIATGLLTPYKTVTPSPIQPSATIKVTIPITPSPTSTPFIYIVKGDDTMISIAYQFGISWEDLQAANPDVDPHYMGDGLKLVIPISGEIPESLPTPTPVTIHVEQPVCYPTGDRGAWCVVSLKNETETSLENLSTWIGLYNLKGELIASQVAYASLNILRPGSTIPLMAYFAPPLPEGYQAQSEVLSGLQVAGDDTRYIDLQVKVGSAKIAEDGSQAQVSGDVIVPDGTPNISQLWALAVAYDLNGNTVGARKWKSDGKAKFEITVYSLGGKIDHLDVLIEARP